MSKYKMKTLLIIIAIFQFNTCQLFGQTKIPLPKNKNDLFQEHENHYEEWIEKINQFNELLNSDDELTHYEKANIYYNRFNTYYKALPDDSTDILYIFFDAFNYDKDYFCESYLRIIKNMNIHDWVKPSYGIVGLNMNRLCECVFQSYNKKLIKKLEELRERDQKIQVKRKRHEKTICFRLFKYD